MTARKKKAIPDTPAQEGWGKTWVCGPYIDSKGDSWHQGCGAIWKLFSRDSKSVDRMVVCPLCGRIQERKNDSVFDPTKMIQQAAHRGDKPLLIENAAEAWRKKRVGLG